MYRVLKPGRFLLLSTPNAQHWHRIAYLLAGRRDPDTEFGDDTAHRHHQVFSMVELVELPKRARFSTAASRYEDCYDLAQSEPPQHFALVGQLASLPEYQKEHIFILAKRSDR
jgi:hypothetical protein